MKILIGMYPSYRLPLRPELMYVHTVEHRSELFTETDSGRTIHRCYTVRNNNVYMERNTILTLIINVVALSYSCY